MAWNFGGLCPQLGFALAASAGFTTVSCSSAALRSAALLGQLDVLLLSGDLHLNLGLGHFFGALLAQHAGVHLGGGDVLGGDVFLDLIGCVGLGALGLLLFAESLELQLFVLFRLGDGGFSGQTGLFPQLAGLGGLDLLGFIGFGFSNAGLGFHFGNLGAARETM